MILIYHLTYFQFYSDSFDNYINTYNGYQYIRDNFDQWKTGSNSEKKKLSELKKIFNQNILRYHVLPSFLP